MYDVSNFAVFHNHNNLPMTRANTDVHLFLLKSSTVWTNGGDHSLSKTFMGKLYLRVVKLQVRPR